MRISQKQTNYSLFLQFLQTAASAERTHNSSNASTRAIRTLGFLSNDISFQAWRTFETISTGAKWAHNKTSGPKRINNNTQSTFFSRMLLVLQKIQVIQWKWFRFLKMNKVTEEKIYDYALPSMTLYPFSKAKLRPCPHLPTRAITNSNEANEIVNRI